MGHYLKASTRLALRVGAALVLLIGVIAFFKIAERSAEPRLALPTPAPPQVHHPPAVKPASSAAEAAPGAQIAIIIDDLGNNWTQGQVAAHLPGQITLAIIPFAPHSHKLAQTAREQNKEIMAHIPMQPIAHKAWRDGLRSDMELPELREALTAMLDALPGSVGVNNHMGSALTQDPERMAWVMETLLERELYFIDSRTSAATQAHKVARAMSVPSLSRDVFLDNVRSREAIDEQLQKLTELARDRGYAIGIGHPYPETLNALTHYLNDSKFADVTLVPASILINRIYP